MVRPGVFMASVGLKDAFLSIPIHPKHNKYCWDANGCDNAMRIFTKLTKLHFFFLRVEKPESVIHVDDPYLQGDTYEEYWLNVATTMKLLGSSGFIMRMQTNCYLDKSQFIPTDIN